ncbi:acyltransferase [Rhizobium sp. YIM 134829]|uniref:acyltransferase n=1 Tax=Rhizobium sp. YIM 134829 TaxID=3390453 RepID=UPI00397C723C
MQGIDAFRVLAFIFVVALHADRTNLPTDLVLTLETLPRFGVPYFFLTAGYFLKIDGVTPLALAAKLLKRLLPIYSLWVLVYLAVNRAVFGNFGISKIGSLFLDGGPGYHLWFIPALGLSIFTVFLIARTFGDRTLLVVCLCLFVIGTYFIEFLEPFGPPLPWKFFRNGPFFGAIFVALGYLIRKHHWHPRLGLGLTLFTGGFLISLGERFALASAGLISPTESINYTYGTIAFGVGAFALALNLPSNARLVQNMAGLGRLTLGFYCIHLLFLWFVQWMLGPESTVTLLIAIAATTVLSITAILLVSRLKWSAPLIR